MSRSTGPTARTPDLRPSPREAALRRRQLISLTASLGVHLALALCFAFSESCDTRPERYGTIELDLDELAPRLAPPLEPWGDNQDEPGRADQQGRTPRGRARGALVEAPAPARRAGDPDAERRRAEWLIPPSASAASDAEQAPARPSALARAATASDPAKSARPSTVSAAAEASRPSTVSAAAEASRPAAPGAPETRAAAARAAEAILALLSALSTPALANGQPVEPLTHSAPDDELEALASSSARPDPAAAAATRSQTPAAESSPAALAQASASERSRASGAVAALSRRAAAAEARAARPVDDDTLPRDPSPVALLSAVEREIAERREHNAQAVAAARRREAAAEHTLAAFVRETGRVARSSAGAFEGARVGLGGTETSGDGDAAGGRTPAYGLKFYLSGRHVEHTKVVRPPELIFMPKLPCKVRSLAITPATVRMLVDAKGNVGHFYLKHSSSDAHFDQCAIRHTAAMKFKPGVDELGAPLNVWIHVRVEPSTLTAQVGT